VQFDQEVTFVAIFYNLFVYVRIMLYHFAIKMNYISLLFILYQNQVMNSASLAVLLFICAACKESLSIYPSLCLSI